MTAMYINSHEVKRNNKIGKRHNLFSKSRRDILLLRAEWHRAININLVSE